MTRRHLLTLLSASAVLAACDRHGVAGKDGKTALRIGHFPNITHAQGVIAHELSRQGKGWFEERLGPGVEVQWLVYNAGPSAIEGIFTDSIDVTYIGPSPVLNGYIKAGGEEIRVISGATQGGAALVVKKEGGPATPADFRGKRIATPQLGNTQDIACRVWLGKNGLHVTQLGGDAQVLPTANPDQLALFQQGKIDAVWTVEPWVSRLEREAGGRIFLEQKGEFATVVAASTKALKEKGEILKKFVTAHEELTNWITGHPATAKELFRSGFKEITHGEISAELLEQAWPRLAFTTEVGLPAFEKALAEAQSVDLLPKTAPKLDRLMAVPQ